jgi:D-alanine-D-alanine ligase
MNGFHMTRTDLPVLLLYNVDYKWLPEEIDEVHAATKILSEALQNEGHPVEEIYLDNTDLPFLLRKYDPEKYLVFNWCEEFPQIPRSSALVAQTLESLGFTFTGTDSLALAFSQDKRLVKQRLDELGISTPAWRICDIAGPCAWNCFPAIVKPAFEHCSFGITRDAIVQSPGELEERVNYVFETFGQPALIEEFIDGREFHVTVIGNGTIHMLPPAEMDFSFFGNVKDRLCSYDSKFDTHSTAYNLIELKLPAQLTKREQALLEKVAYNAYRATNCRDYARLDIRLRGGDFYLLDVNPNADISPDTSVALSAEMAGLSYGKLSSLLVNLASQRHPVYQSLIQK